MFPRRGQIALSLLPGVGAKSLRRALERQAAIPRSWDELVSLPAPQIAEEYSLPEQSVTELQSKASQYDAQAAEIESLLARAGAYWMTIADSAYPNRLLALDEPPPILYGYGDWELLSKPKAALMLSRKFSDAAGQETEELARLFGEQGFTIVTSLHPEGYRRSVMACLRHNLPYCLALDRGLLDAFGDDLRKEPLAAARIWRAEFDPYRALAISAFRPRDPWRAPSGLLRDELVIALSDTVIAVEISQGGQIDRLLKDAVRRGQDVRAIATEDRPGNQELIEAGATPFGAP